jgi:hypothetical protein
MLMLNMLITCIYRMRLLCGLLQHGGEQRTAGGQAAAARFAD